MYKNHTESLKQTREEQDVLIQLDEDDTKLKQSYLIEWQKTLEDIKLRFDTIKVDLEDLNILQMNALVPSFADTKDKHNDVKRLTQKIIKSLSTIKQEVKLFGSNITLNDQSIIIRNNIRAYLLNRLKELTEIFQLSKNKFMTKMNEKKEKHKPHFQNNDDDLIEVEMDDIFSDEQLQIKNKNKKLLEKRETEIKNIAESLIELNQLFTDINELVLEQGVTINNIEKNIDSANNYIKDANDELTSATGYAKSGNNCLCYILLAALTVLLLVGVIVGLTVYTNGSFTPVTNSTAPISFINSTASQ